MTTSIHRLIGNFEYHISSIVPTNTTVKNRFESYDPMKDNVPDSSAGCRKFYVEYMSSESEGGATDIVSREAWHTVNVHIEYPCRFGFNDTQIMILQDRHQVIKKLRDTTSWVGYRDLTGTDATANIGLIHRLSAGTALTKISPELWRLTYQFKCYQLESEL